MKLRKDHDPQAERLYDAEDAWSDDERIVRFTSLDSTLDYAAAIVESEFWRFNFAVVAGVWATHPERDHNVPAMALHDPDLEEGVIKLVLPPWAWRQDVVLHELAHIAHQLSAFRGRGASHGREYAAVLLALIRFAMGDDTAERLGRQFERRGVEVSAALHFTRYRETAPAAVDRLNGAIALKGSL
jgi:putative metallohydrolase (TIGR04338 family)